MDVQEQLLREWRDAWFDAKENELIASGHIKTKKPRKNIPTNTNILLELINTYPDVGWKWAVICENFIYTPLDEILQFPDLFPRWNWQQICHHPDVTEEIVAKYPNAHWDYFVLTKHANISTQFIFKHANHPWSWNYISNHPSITEHIVLANPNIPWTYGGLRCNRNISTNFVKKMFPQKELNKNFVLFCEKDMQNHVEYQTTQILIMSIYEYYFHIEPNCQLAKIEYVLADEYLAKLISLF
jgi:hypothetical protein